MGPETGIDQTHRAEVAKHLGGILDASYSLMVRSHLYHWNIRGPLFEPLHKLLEHHYTALFAAVDQIAERILQLGFRAPSTGTAIFPSGVGLSQEALSARSMIEDLLHRHEQASRDARDACRRAEEADDFVTTDMLAKHLAFHEKAAWMLRATLTGWSHDS